LLAPIRVDVPYKFPFSLQIPALWDVSLALPYFRFFWRCHSPRFRSSAGLRTFGPFPTLNVLIFFFLVVLGNSFPPALGSVLKESLLQGPASPLPDHRVFFTFFPILSGTPLRFSFFVFFVSLFLATDTPCSISPSNKAETRGRFSPCPFLLLFPFCWASSGRSHNLKLARRHTFSVRRQHFLHFWLFTSTFPRL